MPTPLVEHSVLVALPDHAVSLVTTPPAIFMIVPPTANTYADVDGHVGLPYPQSPIATTTVTPSAVSACRLLSYWFCDENSLVPYEYDSTCGRGLAVRMAVMRFALD